MISPLLERAARRRAFPATLRVYASWLSRALSEAGASKSVSAAAAQIGGELKLPEHSPFVEAYEQAARSSGDRWLALSQELERALERACAVHRQLVAFNVASAGQRLAHAAASGGRLLEPAPAYEPDLAERIDALKLARSIAACTKLAGFSARVAAQSEESARVTVASGDQKRLAQLLTAKLPSEFGFRSASPRAGEHAAWELGDRRDWRAGNACARVSLCELDPSANSAAVSVTVERAKRALGESMKITVAQLRRIIAEAQRDRVEPFPKTLEAYAAWLQAALRAAGAPEDFCFTIGQMGRVDDATHDEFVTVWREAQREISRAPAGPDNVDGWDALWSLGLYDAVIDAADTWMHRRDVQPFNAASVADRLESLIGKPLPKLSKSGKILGRASRSMPAYEPSLAERVDPAAIVNDLAKIARAAGATSAKPVVGVAGGGGRVVAGVSDERAFKSFSSKLDAALTSDGVNGIALQSRDPDPEYDETLAWEAKTEQGRVYVGLGSLSKGRVEIEVVVEKPMPKYRRPSY